jgi:TBC1 domain family member 5
MDNPLMATDDSKWNKYFAAQTLRDEIMNDIERTYPEFEFFRLESTQKCLCQVLYIWCAMNPRISYRQGMNELLAPIVFVMSQEYTDPREGMEPGVSGSIGVIESLLDMKYLEHDAFSMFETVMHSMMILFDTDPADPKEMTAAMRKYMNELGGGRGANPSVMRVRQVHTLLDKLDNTLYKHIQTLEIQPQLYALKWMRLLFSREFHLEDTLVIWDSLFCAGPDLPLLDYMAIAMLMFIRRDMLEMDDTMALLGIFTPFSRHFHAIFHAIFTPFSRHFHAIFTPFSRHFHADTMGL